MTPWQDSLRDKVVVLTGASSGIGAAAVPWFHDAGAHVVAVARRRGPRPLEGRGVGRELPRVRAAR